MVPAESSPVVFGTDVHAVEATQLSSLQLRVLVGLRAFDRGRDLVAGGGVERRESAMSPGLVVVEIQAARRPGRGVFREIRPGERRQVEAKDMDFSKRDILEAFRRLADGGAGGKPAEKRPRVARVRDCPLTRVADPGDQAEQRIHMRLDGLHGKPRAPSRRPRVGLSRRRRLDDRDDEQVHLVVAGERLEHDPGSHGKPVAGRCRHDRTDEEQIPRGHLLASWHSPAAAWEAMRRHLLMP
ncbi:MAG: hypothetical protein DMD81_18330 [Candidatus Rokuibacteriota bacterium]|nr:MAG: hypothetical protein DMD81_18330 [Candidatus Rokubacteria bacterium]